MRYSTLVTGTLLFAISTSALGQVIFKCVTKGKPTSFQNEPCSGNATLVRAVPYTPDVVGPYRPNVHARPYANAAEGLVATLPVARTPDQCELARTNRERVLGKNNQGGNYKVRVQLNDAVHRACN